MAYFVRLKEGKTYDLQGIVLTNPGSFKEVSERIYNYVKNNPRFEVVKADSNPSLTKTKAPSKSVKDSDPETPAETGKEGIDLDSVHWGKLEKYSHEKLDAIASQVGVENYPENGTKKEKAAAILAEYLGDEEDDDEE